jgi:hypothetical protein
VAKTDSVIVTQTYHPTVLFVKMSTNFKIKAEVSDYIHQKKTIKLISFKQKFILIQIKSVGRVCGTNGDEKEMYTKLVKKSDWKRLISIELQLLLLLLIII